MLREYEAKKKKNPRVVNKTSIDLDIGNTEGRELNNRQRKKRLGQEGSHGRRLLGMS